MEEREETLEDLGIFLHDATQEEAHEPMSSEGDPQKDSNDLPLDLAVSYVADRYGSEQNVSQSCSTPDIVSTDHPSVSEEVFTPDQKGEVTPDSNPSLVTSPQPLNDVFDANKLEHEPAAERRGGSCGNDHPTSQQSDEMEFIVTTGDKSAPEPESKPKKTRRPPGFSCMRCRLAKKPVSLLPKVMPQDVSTDLNLSARLLAHRGYVPPVISLEVLVMEAQSYVDAPFSRMSSTYSRRVCTSLWWLILRTRSDNKSRLSQPA